MDNEDPLLYQTFFNHYYLNKKLGEGSFGKIYLSEYQGNKYALKFENKIDSQNLLKNESYFLKYLKSGKLYYYIIIRLHS